MVGITYTGTNGQVHTFDSASPAEAMERLGRIPGYRGNAMDQIAIGFEGMMERRKSRRRDIEPRQGLFGRYDGNVFSSADGRVVSTPSVSGIEMRDGKLYQTTRRQYVSEQGRVLGEGARRERIVGTVTPETHEENVLTGASLVKDDKTGEISLRLSTKRVQVSGSVIGEPVDIPLN